MPQMEPESARTRMTPGFGRGHLHEPLPIGRIAEATGFSEAATDATRFRQDLWHAASGHPSR